MDDLFGPVACAAGLFLSALIIIIQSVIHARKVSELKRKIKEPEFVQYVDTSGVDCIPPKYIDTWQGKTINIKFGRWAVKIPMLRAVDFFRYADRIARNYSVMCGMITDKPDENRWVKSHLYARLHEQNAILIYRLSRPFVRDRRKYKKALLAESKKNIAFVIGICEQVLDFWTLVKKKAFLLSQGATERQTDGKSSFKNSSGSDGESTQYATPRYAF